MTTTFHNQPIECYNQQQGLTAPCEPRVVFRVNSSNGISAVYVGGNYNSNDNYGFFYTNANNSATNTNDNLGSRHLVISTSMRSLSLAAR